jgi:hypothetical protein
MCRSVTTILADRDGANVTRSARFRQQLECENDYL